MAIAFKKIFNLLIILTFAAFIIIWVYDAITVTESDVVSMFYVHRSMYITQIYPRFLGLAVPALFIALWTIFVFTLRKYRLFEWVLGIGVLAMNIMSIVSTNGRIYWSNPFFRHNVYPMAIDYWLGAFLYLSLIIDIIYLGYLLYEASVNVGQM